MKDKFAALLLGVFLAWTGLPGLLHAGYWALIVAGFLSGHFLWK